MSNQNKFDFREKISLGVSVAIVLASIVYWIIQIGDVVEMFKLAG
jgi:hypothetical protein